MKINGDKSGEGRDPIVTSLAVVENGTYSPALGVDGFNPVEVNVPDPELQDKTLTENGTYSADEGYYGLNEVTVNVPDPVLQTKTITENGTYTPETGVDGYNQVDVNVLPNLQDKTITENGTYSADLGYDGFGHIDVNVPSEEPVLETLNVTDNGTYTAPSGVDGYNVVSVNVPQSVTGYTEKDLTEKTFTLVNLNNSASFVASSAFQNNSTLRTVNLPNCVSVGNNAFQSCYNLSQVSIPNCVYISGGAFWNCSLTQISLPECRQIMNYGFRNCSQLQSVYLPKCIQIDAQALQSCINLSNVYLPMCISLNTQVFSDCSSLQMLDLPNCIYIGYWGRLSNLSILSIGTKYFGLVSYSNSSLPLTVQSIYVYEGQYSNYLTATGWSSFADKFVSVGDPTKPLLKFDSETGRLYGYTEILNSKFSNEFKSAFSISNNIIQFIDLPSCELLVNGNQWDGVFNGCSILQTASLPICNYIGSYAFRGCSSLQILDLPVCSYIGGPSTFQSCTSLSQVILRNNRICHLDNNNVFPNANSAMVYVPASLVDAYKSATNWVSMSSRIFPIPE